MKNFMGNPCGYGNCLSDECEKCRCYKPTFFRIKVPKWLGNTLFRVENWLINRGVKHGRF